jgi:acyl-CoA thioesterase
MDADAQLPVHTVPYGTDSSLRFFQALRARLPSSYPSGIEEVTFQRLVLRNDQMTETTNSDEIKLAEHVAQGMLAQDAMSRALGITIVEIRPGYARLKMTVRSDMSNSHSICHGGAIFTLADSAFAFACNSYNRSTVASGGSIDFVTPARIGDELTAEATERALPGRLGLYDVTVTNQSGQPIAFFRGRSYRVTGETIKEFKELQEFRSSE